MASQPCICGHTWQKHAWAEPRSPLGYTLAICRAQDVDGYDGNHCNCDYYEKEV
jgi:hypothetical protein